MRSIAILLMMVLPMVVLGQASSVRVFVNGTELPVKGFVRNGITYLPAQALADALGVKLQWNPTTRQLRANNALVSAPVIMRDGVLFAPVEGIVQTIGANLEWDGATRTIYVKTGSAIVPKDPPLPTFTPDPPAPPSRIPEPEVFVPRMVANADYSVTVTNVNEVRVIKDYYRPKSGYKFAIVHVSQQNISDKVQLYTGRFVLEDHQGQTHEYVEGLSNFWLQILRPGGINFGSLVFEIPLSVSPAKLVLHSYGTSPLILSLR